MVREILLSLLVFSTLGAMECETWVAAGAGSRSDESHFKGTSFKVKNFTPDGEKFYLPSTEDFKYDEDDTFTVVQGWVKTRADNAMFKVYWTWGEQDDRSVNNLWLGMGYWADFFCYRFAVIPAFGVTVHHHQLMEVKSAYVGLDLRYSITPKWTLYGDFGYHACNFRERKKSPFEFKSKKGHGYTGRFGTHFFLYKGWFAGLEIDMQDWDSSDAKRITWRVRDVTAHIGYYY